MRIALMICTAMLCASASVAQNLVQNPSFEQYPTCPAVASGYDLGVPLLTPGIVNQWFNPTPTSPDWLHVCMGGATQTRLNLQAPQTGDGLANLRISRHPAYVNNSGVDWREYLQGYLDCPLVAGETYRVSFWVKNSTKAQFATDGVAACVSVDPPTGTTNNGITNLTAAQQSTTIYNPDFNYISSAGSWMEIAGNIVANGGERWITIGYFTPGIPNTLDLGTNNTEDGDAIMILVDDVSVTPLNASPYTCPHTEWIENTPYYALPTPYNVTAGQFIEAGFSVGHPMPNGYVNVWPGATTNYTAGKAIDLEPGFTAMVNQVSHFQACIIPNICPSVDPAVADAGPDIFWSCGDPHPLIGLDCSEDSYHWVSANPPQAINWLNSDNTCTSHVFIPLDAYEQGITQITYVLAVNEEWCDANYDEVTIYIQPLDYGIDAGPDGTINQAPFCNDFVPLGGPGQPGIVYEWSPAAGLNNHTYPNPQASYDPNLTYPVTYTLTGHLANGCIAGTDQVVVDYEPGIQCVLNLSTGYTNGALATVNSQLDDHWKYVADNVSAITPEPMKIYYSSAGNYGNWIPHGPGSRWIVPQNVFPINNGGGVPDNAANELYEFERSFFIPNLNNISDVRLQVNAIAMDNSARLYINDNNNGTPIPGNSTNLWIHPTLEATAGNYATLHNNIGNIPISNAELYNGSNRITFDMINRFYEDIEDPNLISLMGLQFEGKLLYKSCGPCSIKNTPAGGGGGGQDDDSRKSLLNAGTDPLYGVYPNPGTGIFYLAVKHLPADGDFMLIRDLSGRILHQIMLSDQYTYTFDLQTEADGVYLVELLLNGERYHERLVKH